MVNIVIIGFKHHIAAITNYMNYDNGELKKILANVIIGHKVEVDTKEFEK